MGFFSKLAGLGLLAGAATAGILVGRKYIDNKASEKAQLNSAINLDSVENAASAPKKTVAQDVKKAANDVLEDAKSVIYTKAESVGINTKELTSTVGEASKAIADASRVVAVKVYDKTPEVVDTLKHKVEEFMTSKNMATYVEPMANEAQMLNSETLNEEVADILTIAEQEMK